MLNYTRNSEVANLYFIVAVEEDVLCFEVSVQNFAVMYVLECERHLHEPVEDLLFRDETTLFALLLNHAVEVAVVSKLCHDAKALLLHEALLVADDVGMAQRLEHLDLVKRRLLLLVLHLRNIDNLESVVVLVLLVLDEDNYSKVALAEHLNLFVFFHSLNVY